LGVGLDEEVLTTAIFQRRRIERAQPDRIHPQLGEIRDLGGNPLEISYPVAIGIME
jgi:hypothetical protein